MTICKNTSYIYCPNPAANAMQNYSHIYKYDALGNILSDHWKGYIYDTETNRLLKHDQNQTLDDYTYDEHGNMLTMPHLKNYWDEKDLLFSAGNPTFINYNNYDTQGNRTRKTVEKGNIKETRYYINGYELFRKEVNGSLETERTTINVADDEKVFVRIETETGQNEVVRYQYDNHLGSACLELDETGDIISYEEYHPFGTTSYRSGRTYVEVSLKRYKYCGKERDEETGLYYYGMRFYAAWICRFVSVDPLQFEYPEYTPYQYAGNKPITFIDLDGLEPGIVLGNREQIDSVNSHEDNTNYIGIELITLEDAYNKVKEHKEKGNSIDVIYLQTHGSSDSVYLGPGPDGVLNTESVSANARFFHTDDEKIWSGDINYYLGLSKKEIKEYIKTSKGKAMYDLQQLTSLLDENGVLIFGACNLAQGDRGDDFLKSVGKLINKTVIASQDVVSDVAKIKKTKSSVDEETLEVISTETQTFQLFLDEGRLNNLIKGWKILEKGKTEIETIEKNLFLQSNGKMYEFR